MAIRIANKPISQYFQAIQFHSYLIKVNILISLLRKYWTLQNTYTQYSTILYFTGLSVSIFEEYLIIYKCWNVLLMQQTSLLKCQFHLVKWKIHWKMKALTFEIRTCQINLLSGLHGRSWWISICGDIQNTVSWATCFSWTILSMEIGLNLNSYLPL